jgi:Ca-activated chloride channel homolog
VSLDATWETIVDSDGGPLLAIREAGGRRQAVLTFDLSQSDLPLRPAFPVLMANLLEWLLPRPGEAPRAVAPGVAIAIDAAPLAREVWVEDAEGKREQLAPPWPPVPFRPPLPGLYQVVQEGDGTRVEFALIADGYHHLEADLTVRSVEIPLAAGDVPPIAQGAMAFWPWLVALVLLLSMAEWWIDARGR